MLAVFGQFLDHDMTATAISRGTNGSSIACCEPHVNHPECFPVIIEPDLTQGIAESSCMEFVRSAPAAQCKIGPRQQLNQVTSFIDGSQIYGADLKTARGLREFSKGYLRMQISPDNRTLLPVSDNPNDGCNKDEEILHGRYCFASGDPRANENLHLTTMHLIWARQHNKISNHLSTINPLWSDEKLYQESRRIVGAQLQHITYNEFLPIIIGENEMKKKDLKPLTAGFRLNRYKNVDPTIANSFASAAFRFAHTLLPGLMKITDDEEGTDSYIHLHKMLFNPYSLYTEAGLKSSIKSAISNFIQKTSTHVTSQLTTHLFEDQSTNTTKPSSCGLDLVSLNIQRGRDHGLPSYTKWREYCNLSVPASFNDLKSILDLESSNAISSLYESVEDIDLYTGALAEIPSGGSLLGPTFTCLISDQFKKLLFGDRFWYEFQNQSGSFTEEQLEQIRKTSLAGVICDNADTITEVQKDVMRSVSVTNPIISCQNLSQPSYLAWKMPPLRLKSLYNDVIIGDWLNFKNDINSTLNNIVTNIASKKPPPGSFISDWIVFKQNVNKSFTDFKNQFSDLHKSILNLTFTPNLEMKSQPLKLIKTNDSLDEIFSKIDQIINIKKIDLSNLPSNWTLYHEKINDSIANIKTFFEKIHTVVPPAQLKTLTSIENVYGGKINNKSSNFLKKFIVSKDNNISSIVDEWFTMKSEIKKNVDEIKKSIFKMKMLELTLCQFFNEGVFEGPETFECNAFMDNIFKRIFNEINTISPIDENSESNLNFVKESLSNLKDTLLHFNSEKYQSKLFLQLGFDWMEVGDKINSTIENSLNSIPLCQAMKEVNFLYYKKCIKDNFLGIHASVKNVISDWLIDFQNSIEVSKIPTLEKLSSNSASASRSLVFNDLLFVTFYIITFVLTCMNK
ncbi:chorion peroxidase-like [Trichogramma pretiosum]|uniref:chorion peroxidase-like n=1 Tax=Trichogramma pretiosum TaxID=7493 RepID=UPI000C71A211|nr:chorion peroxidase-like [Trichogramma pretiosum]